jgi:hypothetical protein
MSIAEEVEVLDRLEGGLAADTIMNVCATVTGWFRCKSTRLTLCSTCMGVRTCALEHVCSMPLEHRVRVAERVGHTWAIGPARGLG